MFSPLYSPVIRNLESGRIQSLGKRQCSRSESRPGIFLGDSVYPGTRGWSPPLCAPPPHLTHSSQALSSASAGRPWMSFTLCSISTPHPNPPSGPREEGRTLPDPSVCPDLPPLSVSPTPSPLAFCSHVVICTGLRAESSDFQLISPPTSDCTSKPCSCH